jgi:radical SAM superfamily enzyme YgiQ (UPF0313 family)
MMDKTAPHLLLINPWIHDFAAYDFWAKPLGLLTLAAILRQHGYGITYIDCLDRFHPEMTDAGKGGQFGKGPYHKTPIAKPEKLLDVPRQYSRYGLPENLVRKAISESPNPEAVLVTCIVTYWYPGVVALIEVIREMLPGVPVILGGIYASLCHQHAVKHSGADTVLPGPCEVSLLEHLGHLTGYVSALQLSPDELDAYPYPALDLQSHIAYAPLLTGQGCPFSCAYCASPFLNPKMRRRSPEHVVEEIAYWHERFEVFDFAFYDDALLIDGGRHIVPILEGILARALKVRFHTPNALHVRPLSKKLAQLLFRAGFKTIRLGLETALFDERQALDDKVEPGEFQGAVHHLKTAGFSSEDVGAYLLCGLPGQDSANLEASIDTVKALGVRPILAQYSPIPHTALWPEAVAASRYDLSADPIFHNNSIFPCQKDPFSWEKIAHLKDLIQTKERSI